MTKGQISMSNTTDTVILDQAGIDAVNSLIRVRKELRELEALKAQAEQLVRAALNGASKGLIAGSLTPVVRVSKRVRGTTDRKLLEENFPEIFELTDKKTEYEVLLTT